MPQMATIKKEKVQNGSFPGLIGLLSKDVWKRSFYLAMSTLSIPCL